MAYYVSSAVDPNVIEGPLLIRAGVSPANVDRAVASIDEELTRLVAGRHHRQRAGRFAQLPDRSMPRALETNAAIADVPADGGVFRPGYRLRRPHARNCCAP